MNLEEFPTNEEWTIYDWQETFQLGSEADGGYTVRSATAPSVPLGREITPDDVTRVVRWHGESPEGWGSVSVAAVVELTDGSWAVVTAWADTTGWGCRDGVDWHVGSTEEQVVQFGLGSEERRQLGYEATP